MSALLRDCGRACAAALLLAYTAQAVAAQDPTPPRPRIPVDSLPVRRDTLPADTIAAVQDTVIPPAVRFPGMPPARDPAVDGTEWIWDREALLLEAAVSLLDLLERIPGITTFRVGTFLQPEAASVFGSTAGRTEIEIDGYILDPLAAATFDLSQVALGQLREVRVQRRLGLLRVVLTTEFPDEGQPYTRVEAGIGVPAANLFRGQFLVPHVIVGPLALGIERMDTDGTGRSQPADMFTGWGKWSWTNGERGVQLEFIRGTLKRERNSPWLINRARQDVVVRARNRFGDAFTAEIYAGRATIDQTVPSSDEGVADVHTERESIQAGARGGLRLPWGSFTAAARYRSEEGLPAAEGSLDGDIGIGPLRIGGDVGFAAWEGSYPTSHVGIRGSTSLLYGLSAFGEMTRGQRGAPSYLDTFEDGVQFTERSGWRAGLALELGRRASGSAAWVSLDQDWIVPFGLPFDTAGRPVLIGSATGIEARGQIVLWPGLLTLSSWITDWQDAPGWTYLPSRSWRTALELHTLPLSSGNLEILGRAEAHMRGSTLVWDPEMPGPSFIAIPSFTTTDAYLQIRIIDVRMFVRYEDIIGPDIQELPGLVYRGPRIFYGVKWDLRN